MNETNEYGGRLAGLESDVNGKNCAVSQKNIEYLNMVQEYWKNHKARENIPWEDREIDML